MSDTNEPTKSEPSTSGEGERGVLVVSSRQEYLFACLDCGARHRVIIVNKEPTVTLERED